MNNLDKIASDLFSKIRGRFENLTIGNEAGEVVTEPETARFFDFTFTTEGKSLGKVSVALSEDDGISVTFSNDFINNEDQGTQNVWYSFLKELRQFAKKRMLNFDIRDINRSNLKKRDYNFLANTGDTQMTESKLYGTSRTSYQDVDSARIVIKHRANVNQENPVSRTQGIGSIYIESADGERFKYPYRHLNGARAMARHVAEGGKPFDEFGQHITGLSEELSSLRKFKNYMSRSSVMAEGLARYVDAVSERIETIKSRVQGLQRTGYYTEAVEGFEATVMEDVPDDVRENWIDQLTIRQFNEELKDVFPYVYRLVSETTLAEEIGPEDLLDEDGDLSMMANSRDRVERTYAEVLKGVRGRGPAEPSEVGDYIPRGMTKDEILKLVDMLAQSGKYDEDEIEAMLKDMAPMMEVDSYDDAIETSFEDLMGQFSEADKEAVDDATLIAQELKKMGVSSNASEKEIYDMIPKAIKSLNLGSVLRQMNISKGYRRDIVDNVIGAFSGMKEDDVLFKVKDPKSEKIFKIVDYMGKLQAFDNDPHSEEGGGQGPWVYDEKNNSLEDYYGPDEDLKVAKIDEQTSEADRDNDMDAALHKRFGIEGDFVPFDERPRDGEEIELQVPVRYTKAEQVIRDTFSNETGIDKDKVSVEYTRGARSVKIDGQTPHPEILSALNGTLDSLDTGGIAGMYDDTDNASESDESSEQQQLPLGEYVMQFVNPKTGQIPKGETAVLTKVEKEYGEEYIETAKKMLEMINNKVAEVMGYKDTDMQENRKLNDADKKVMQKLTGMIKQKQQEMEDARKGGHDEDVRMIASQLEDFYSIAELIQGKRPMGLDTSVMDLVHDMYDEVGAKFDQGNEELSRIKDLAGL